MKTFVTISALVLMASMVHGVKEGCCEFLDGSGKIVKTICASPDADKTSGVYTNIPYYKSWQCGANSWMKIKEKSASEPVLSLAGSDSKKILIKGEKKDSQAQVFMVPKEWAPLATIFTQPGCQGTSTVLPIVDEMLYWS